MSRSVNRGPIPDREALRQARARIADCIHATPVMTCTSLDQQSGARLFFKCENLQKVGAFKMRGASNAVLCLDDAARRRGVVTHSSGNHAQALACAAACTGVSAHIVMPESAPAVKVAAVRGYGADITFCAPTMAAREKTLDQLRETTGALFIPPYDNPDVIAGQATCAMELLEQVADLDCMITPVGGGGLLSGAALAVDYHASHTRVFGAEPSGADDAARSLHAGKLRGNAEVQTIADGLHADLGKLPFQIIKPRVSDILVVDDGDIIAAMHLLFERMKLVVEPSAATALAAVYKHREIFAGLRVGIVLSGGNVDLSELPF